jgi:DNA-binding beta-propeller fold protein YncE
MNRRKGRLRGTWGFYLVCVLLPVVALWQIGHQMLNPPPPQPLMMVRDIALPSPFPDARRTAQNPFAPGAALLFDHFDFQALDSARHLLFIAHSGPSPDREQQINPHFDQNTDAKTDGNVIVFDTKQQKVVHLLPIPQVAGVVLAPDLNKVYAADSNDNIIYAIDENTFQTKQIVLQDNDSPDAITYDQIDHLILVSDPGTPADPDKTNVIVRKNQNETLIDAITDQVLGRVMLGLDGKWGDDVGHVKYDPGLQRAFVTTQQLADPDSMDPNLLPPAGKSWLVEIDPRTRSMTGRITLPNFCITPHGLAIDSVSQIAFVACVDSTPATLVRIDLQRMQVIQEKAPAVEANPDMLVIDTKLHVLYVAAEAGISIFEEKGQDFRWLGNYTFGVSVHSLIVDEETHDLYLPLPRMGGRAVLRILHASQTLL